MEKGKHKIAVKFNNLLQVVTRKQPADCPIRTEWILAGIMAAMFFFFMFYADNFGMFLAYFWTNEGTIMGNNLNAFASQGLPYGIVHQYLCELWVLPVNILYHLFEFDLDGTAALLWYKFFTTFFFILCTVELGKIAETVGLKKSEKSWLQFFLVTSLLVALPVFHVAQTDVLYLYFMLLGFHAYLKNDTKKFLIFFAIAIPLKIIAVFAFIPLVLLSEKRILYVLRNLILGCVIIPIEKIIYRIVDSLNIRLFPQKSVTVVQAGDSATKSVTQAKEDFMSHFYNKSLYFEMPAVRKGLVASVLVVILILIFVWCYMQKKEELKQWYQKSVYAVTAALLAFFLLASPSPYWIVILFPFLLLMIFLHPQCFRVNMILESSFTLTMLFVYVIDTYWVFGGSQTFDWLFLSQWGLVPGNHVFQEGPSIAGYLESWGITGLMPVVTAACLASGLALLWINAPGKIYREDIDEEYRKKLNHGFAVFRLLLLAGWFLANVVLLGRY